MKEYLADNGHTYLVYTDAEANKACREYIRENLWAFRAEWLATFIDRSYSKALVDSIKVIQEKMNEDASEIIFKLIGGSSKFSMLTRMAIEDDGRGHFLSPYDGKEHQSKTIPGLPPGKFAYRID
jgi:hypothetical protein